MNNYGFFYMVFYMNNYGFFYMVFSQLLYM